MQLDIRHFRYFLALVDEGSFTRAAARLGIAQSALSGQVSRIERHLGVLLVRRGGRRLELTAAGEELAERARGILAAVRSAEVSVRAQAGRTLLRLGCCRGAWWPRELAGAVESRSPGARVLADTVDTVDGLRRLAEGLLDLYLAADLVTLPVTVPAGLLTRDVLREPVWAAVPAAHPLAGRPSVALADLADDDWLLQPRGSYLRQVVEHLCLEAGFAPKVAASGDPWELSVLMAQGAGVTLCAPLVVPVGDFVVRPLKPAHWRRIFLAWRPNGVADEVVPLVVEAFRATYEEYAGRVPGYSPDWASSAVPVRTTDTG